jgi:hypothetical protein
VEDGLQAKSVFNGYGNRTIHEAQEVQGEVFKGSSEEVFPAYLLKKGRPLYR